MKTTLTFMVAVALVGCGKQEPVPSSETKPTQAAAAATAAKAAAGPDFAAWGLADRKQAWQGSWIVKENGKLQAWTITGDTVQTWDGEKEETFTLKLEAPCRALFATASGMQFPRDFTVAGGKLRFRAGGAGYRKGSEAMFCDASGDIYVVDAAGACARWESKFGDFTKTEAKCGFRKNAEGAEVFFHDGPNEGEYTLEGDAILSRTSFETEPAADHAAARAARDARAAAKE